jgi:hypothetical protein
VLIRLVIFSALVGVFLFVLRAFFAARRARFDQYGKASQLRGEDMVLDPQCQAYLPKSQAILERGHYFCSRECASRYLSQ